MVPIDADKARVWVGIHIPDKALAAARYELIDQLAVHRVGEHASPALIAACRREAEVSSMHESEGMQCLAQLTYIGDAQSAKALRSYLESSSWHLRLMAVEAAVRYGFTEADGAGFVRTALSDEYSKVRVAAARAAFWQHWFGLVEDIERAARVERDPRARQGMFWSAFYLRAYNRTGQRGYVDRTGALADRFEIEWVRFQVG